MKNTKLEAIIEKHDLVGKSYADVVTILSNKSWAYILEIIGYINQHYAIKPDVMRELKKDENVRRILDGKVELEVGKWYKLFVPSYDSYVKFRFNGLRNESGRPMGLGFDVCDKYSDDNDTSGWGEKESNFELMTPEEIQSMLIKKLEADGLKVGCKYICPHFEEEETFKSYDSLEYIEFSDGTDGLTDGNGGYIYINGKFAKIIQPKLTIEQKMEILWNERNAKLI